MRPNRWFFSGSIVESMRWMVLHRPFEPAALIRWDEKAGLPAGCDTLPMFDVLEAQEKETGNEED